MLLLGELGLSCATTFREILPLGLGTSSVFVLVPPRDVGSEMRLGKTYLCCCPVCKGSRILCDNALARVGCSGTSTLTGIVLEVRVCHPLVVAGT